MSSSMTVKTQGTASVMQDNTVLDNVSPTNGVKRKAEDRAKDEVSTPVKAAPASTEKGQGSSKKAKKSDSKGPLLDLKKRRITLKQDPRPLESLLRHDTFTSLLRDFHSHLDTLAGPLEAIPEQFDGLIIMAGHESAAGTLTTLAKALRTHLDKPAFDFGDSQASSASANGAGTISTSALTSAISRLLTQTPYGFTPLDITPTSTTSSAPPPPKLPPSLQYTRWEASSDLQDVYFPPQAREVMKARHEERVKLREECERVIEGMEVGARLERLGITNAPPKRKERDSSIEIVEAEPTPSARSVSKSKERSASPMRRAKAKKPEDDETRKKREEKEAKKIEREKKAAEKQAAAAEKQAVKEHAERQKEKQKQTLSSFFGKAPAEASTSRQPSPVKLAAMAKSDYEKTFLPFAKKQDVVLAPVNRFKRGKGKGLFDDKAASVEELSSWEENGAPEVQNWDKQDFLNDHLNRFPKTQKRRLPEGLKTAPPDISVREVWEAHIDAELSGTQDPRKVLSQLNDRSRFPWKTLLFEGQKRPPYSGTFTKRSAVVGPRTPFAQDPIFEYGYDSDEEWEEAGGDDVDEQPKDDAPEDEEEFGSEEEGEFDDWLDDSEDVVMASPASEDVQLLEADGTPAVIKPVVKKERVVKRVQKLPVIIKGPVWETQIGEEGEEGLGAFRIQLLNDAPFPIDPFKWQSAEAQPTLTAQRGVAVVGLRKNVPCLIDTKTSMAPPSVPVPVTAVKPPSTSNTANGDAPVTKLKARPAVPKIAFPDAYLAELLRIVDGSEKSQVDLSAELRQRFEKITTKVAIDTKLKEVASKARAKGAKWIVNPSAWQQANAFTTKSA